jgi:hypothetical protein
MSQIRVSRHGKVAPFAWRLSDPQESSASSTRVASWLALISGAALLTHGLPWGRTSMKSSIDDEGIPFVRAVDPPARPPAAMLVVDLAGSKGVSVSGRLYTADWNAGRAGRAQSPSTPVPWPPLVTLPSAGRAVSLLLSTNVFPDWVSVRSFDDVDPGDAEPRTSPVAEFNCGRFQAPHCVLRSRRGSVVVDALDPRLLRGRYLTAWASWFVPSAQRGEPGDVAASWLFRLGTEEAR